MHVESESRRCFVFRWFFASGTARARSFCTHQRSRITDSTVFKHIHHKDRRHYVRSRSRHIFLASFGIPRTDGARQVRLACAKPQTSREVDQDPEGGLTRQCNTRPSFLITCCLGITVTRRRPSTSSSSSGRASLVSSVKTYLTNLPSQGRQLRTGKRDVYQQPVACLSPKSSWVKEDPSGRGDNVFVLVSLPSQDQPLVRRDEGTFQAMWKSFGKTALSLPRSHSRKR